MSIIITVNPRVSTFNLKETLDGKNAVSKKKTNVVCLMRYMLI